MATAFTNSDSLGLYHTGAVSAGAVQRDPFACLGGERAGTEAGVRSFLVADEDHLLSVAVDKVFGANGDGEAEIRPVSTTQLAYVGPGGAQGAAVAVGDATTALLEDTNTAMAVRVSRLGSDVFPLGRKLSLTFSKPIGNVLAMANVTNAQRAAGEDHYAGVMLRAHGPNNLTLLKVYVKTLGTQRTTNTTQLGASGAGAIASTGSFADAPLSGWAAVKTSGGTLREIVYYTSRTDNILTVPAAGRARLGTSADAGAATDTVDFVPGIRIAKEAPTSGAIQTIADNLTAPTGVTWNTGYTSATGLDIGSLNSGSNYGLWIHREIPAGASASALMENALVFSWTEQAVSYTEPWSGYYRIEDTTLPTYLLFLGADANPDTTATPDATSASLPFTEALTPPGSGETEYRAVVLRQNSHGLRSVNQWLRPHIIDDTGAAVVGIGEPQNVTLEDAGGGYARLKAVYDILPDGDNLATHFRYYYSTDGVDPEVGVDPYVDVAVGVADTFLGLQRRRLNTLIGPMAIDTDLRVLPRMYRSGDDKESAAATVYQVDIASAPAAQVSGGVRWLGETRGELPAGVEVEPSEIEIDDFWFWVVESGRTELWAGEDLILAFLYDTAAPDNNGLWTTLPHDAYTPSGAGTDGVEAVSETLAYFVVDGVRRAMLDRDVPVLQFAPVDIDPTGTGLASFPSPSPAVSLLGYLVFNVYDPGAAAFVTVAHFDAAGYFLSMVPLIVVANAGEIP